MHIWEKLDQRVAAWREQDYASDFPLISEILQFQKDQSGQLTYLRDPQFRALETYWYLRLVADTPRTMQLYDQLFEKRSEKFLALGIQLGQEYLDYESEADYLNYLASQPQNSSLAESMSLEYASYIMALTMGAGKTVLIGTIIATEFAMSLEYRDERFMKNAVVFAPGTTIIESLKEVSDIPYEKILPAHILKPFLANIKMVYAQVGESDIQVVQGGSYHIVVTNTEKIKLKKRTIKKGQTKFDFERMRQHDALIANRRLNSLASLPSLGVFSDEAHNTYGNKLGDEIKRVRETINHLNAETNLICVVNTTGTPYAGKKTLHDVVFWYGLDQGIKDGILKSLTGSVIAYDFKDTPPREIFDDVVSDFFGKYNNTRLIGGQIAKIAFYFKNQEHLDQSRLLIEAALARINQSPAVILQNTQKSTKAEIDEFNRLNDPATTKRVILLVGKGTEGWNCPSLFATALIRELTSSNNFVLQASTRCLRQVVGNIQPATIYLESHNRRILNDELEQTLGTSLYDLAQTPQETHEAALVFKKTEYPALAITRKKQRLQRMIKPDSAIRFSMPTQKTNGVHKDILSPVLESGSVVLATDTTGKISAEGISLDRFTVASRLARYYHLPFGDIYSALCGLYKTNDIPAEHMSELRLQIEKQTADYKLIDEYTNEVMNIIKFSDDQGKPVFSRNSDGSHYQTIHYTDAKKHLLTHEEGYRSRNTMNFGFHYSPYNFDSLPEQSFLGEMIERLQEKHEDVVDIYFTGGLTNTKQTDFYFPYVGRDGKVHEYFPDFVIVKKDGSFLIVEIKADDKQDDPDVQAKAAAVEKLAALKENHFTYIILYTGAEIPRSKIQQVMEQV